jgi:hypothetical protein
VLKLGLVAGAFLLFALLFLVWLSAKERDNRFCVACHLHEEKYDRFLARAARDLAAAHNPKRSFTCIDCHGGADLPMRLRVWALAAVDTAKFFAGRYKEPDQMQLPLRDQECRQCHTPILRSSPAALTPQQEEALEGRTGDSYHAIRDHDTVKVACVRCHATHTVDGEARLNFVSRARVLPLCRDCHPSMGEEVGYTVR